MRKKLNEKCAEMKRRGMGSEVVIGKGKMNGLMKG